MRIAFLNSTDIRGGAAKAAMRLVESLDKLEFPMGYFVNKKFSQHEFVHASDSVLEQVKIAFNILAERRHYPWVKTKEKRHYHSLAPGGGISLEKILAWKPDLIHLHLVNYGGFSLRKLASLKIPIIWTLHDCWAFTGGCHYPGSCSRYAEKCGLCPLLDAKNAEDASHKKFLIKNNTYLSSNITFVAPSLWIKNKASLSPLTKNKDIVHIPNGIDTEVYRPLDKRTVRQTHQLPQEATIILFVAHNPFDQRKGFNYLLKTLPSLQAKHPNSFLLVIGYADLENLSINIPWRVIQHHHDEEILVQLINCAGILICPSLEDNLPNVIIESMSCGVPVIGFKTGGIPEIITQNMDRLLCPPTKRELLYAMQHALNTPHLLTQFSKNARNSIIQRFNIVETRSKHINLYQELLKTTFKTSRQ